MLWSLEMRSSTLFLLALSLTTLAGCESLLSSDVATERIDADIRITDDGSGYAQISAQLTTAGLGTQAVDLVGGDALEVNHGGYTRQLQTYGSPFDWVTYAAEVPVDWRDVEFQVSLLRSFDLSAPDSWVEMPAPFTPYVDADALSYELDALVLEWENSTRDDMSVHIEGACIFDFNAPIPDRGAVAIDLLNLDPVPSWRGERCTLNVELVRTRYGVIDPALRSGQITAQQVRRTSVDLYQ